MVLICLPLILLVCCQPENLPPDSRLPAHQSGARSRHRHRRPGKGAELTLYFPITGLDVGSETISFRLRDASGGRRQALPPEMELDLGVPCSISAGLTLADVTICAGARCQRYESNGDGNCVGGDAEGRIIRTVQLPRDEVGRMAQARVVSVEFGAGRYWLSRSQRAGLKEFVRRRGLKRPA